MPDKLKEVFKEVYYVSYGDFCVQSILNESDHSDFVFTSHWHERYEILLVYERSIHITLEDEEFELLPGEMAVFAPCIIHEGVTSAQGCKYRAIQFDLKELFGSSNYEQQLESHLMNYTYKISSHIKDEQANKLFNDIVEAHGKTLISQPIIEKSLTCNLLSYLIENHLEEHLIISSDDEKFNKLLQYINFNFKLPITTQSIAELFSYDRSYLCRKFKNQTGMSLIDYLHRCRVEHAQYLIRKNELSLSQIGAECGFSTSSYFSDTFKKIISISPSEWKKRFVKTNPDKQ